MPDVPAGWPPALIATFGGTGHLRPAPGTWGSIAAGVVALAFLTFLPSACYWLLPLVAATATVGGIWASGIYARRVGIEDPPEVVIDEVAGVWVAVLLIPGPVAVASPLLATTLSVLVFRLFDIAKPWPLSLLESLPGGWGIMADDLAAGLLAGGLAAAVLR